MTHTAPGPADRDFALYQRSRDPEALGRVFDATAGKLLLVAMHLVRDAATAEDVLQATFLGAMRNCDQYDPARPVLPWLTGILGNQATILWRERSRRPEPERVAAPSSSDPAQLAAARESADAVAGALDGMPSPYRQVLVLALVHGLRAIEIARALERSPETVRSQLHRGLELLRRALPRSLAVPAVALAMGGFTGRGLAAVRAAVRAQAMTQASTAVATASPAAGALVLWLGGTVLMQKVILGVLGALGAAFLLWFLWPSDQMTGLAPGERTGSPAALRATVDAPATDARTPAEDARQRTAAPEEAAGPRLLVRVVDARTSQPEAGAEVLSVLDLDAASLPEAEREEFDASSLRDVETHARRFGQVWRTGSDGTVSVPQPRGWRAVFVARAGRRYGQAQFAHDGSFELQVALEDDLTLRVRVRGPDRAPRADVAIALALRWPDEPQPNTIRLGVTDRDGLVTAPHLQVGIWELQRLRQLPPSSCRVVPNIPALSHAGVPIDLASLAHEPVDVEIPATGRIAVEQVDARGSPAGICPWVSLRELGATDPAPPDFFVSAGNPDSRTDGDGRLLFPHVGLGARFAVRCGAFPPQEGPGPTQAGEQAVFRFRLHAEARSLRGRALDGNGEPLRYRYIDLRIERADRSESARARTDGNGVFYCALPRRGREDAPMSCVQFHLLERLYYTGIMARVEPKAAADDQVVLGDVVLMPAPLLAAGTLADTEGLFITPTLELRAVDAEGAAAGPPLPAVSVRGPGDHFAIRGWTDAAKLELQVKDTDLLPAAPLRFDRGATDLRLVLQRHGSITATVQHDLPYEQANLLRTEVIADGDAQARRQSWSAGPAAPGRIRINLGALPAGRCTLQVRIAGDPQPLATIAGLEVGHGAARDPRLSALDVRGRVRLARMQVLDGAGAPVRGDGTLLIDDRAEGINWVKLHGGFFVVPVASQPVAATIRVPGFREQRVQGIDADRTVRLEPLLELHARLSPELALPSGVTLHAFARRRGAAANPFEEAMRKQRGPIAGSGQPPTAQTGQRFTFALANEGEFELTFVLARSGGARSVALPTAPAVVAVAASSATPDDVAFAVTDADLQSALRELLRE